MKKFKDEVYREMNKILKNPEKKLIRAFFVQKELLKSPHDLRDQDYLQMETIGWDTIPVYAVRNMVNKVEAEYIDVALQ